MLSKVNPIFRPKKYITNFLSASTKQGGRSQILKYLDFNLRFYHQRARPFLATIWSSGIWHIQQNGVQRKLKIPKEMFLVGDPPVTKPIRNQKTYRSSFVLYLSTYRHIHTLYRFNEVLNTILMIIRNSFVYRGS